MGSRHTAQYLNYGRARGTDEFCSSSGFHDASYVSSRGVRRQRDLRGMGVIAG